MVNDSAVFIFMVNINAVNDSMVNDNVVTIDTCQVYITNDLTLALARTYVSTAVDETIEQATAT